MQLENHVGNPQIIVSYYVSTEDMSVTTTEHL